MSRSLQSLFDLTGRVALVTGGSRGLGLQIAEALGEAGAHIVLVSRKAAELATAAAHLAQLNIRVRTQAVDLRNEEAVGEIIAALQAQEGRLDILINNAGATWGAAAESYPIEAWQKVMHLNVTSAFQLTQSAAVIFFLPQGGGAVINVASIEGLQAHSPEFIGTVAYNTSKGALINMTRALAAEWGPKQIRVNALAPGFFPTRMTASTLDAIGERLKSATPSGRLGGDEDLKGAAVLLASDAGSHITGHVLVVDGGATLI